MKDREHQLQRQCVQWFRVIHPKLIIYAIPNGGQRNIAVARKLKAEGVLSGVPDLHIPIAKKGFNSLYVELKVGNNKPTENQNNIMEQLTQMGNKCVVCWSYEEFTKEVTDYLEAR